MCSSDLRQQKELSRKLQNTIGINARLNPYIASRALIEWSSSAKKIRHRKYACQSIVTIINDHDMTEPIRYCTEKISPSFFRLPAIWKHEPKPGKLIATLHANGADISLSNLPFGLLSQNPVLRQQFNQQCRVPFSLAETENLVRRSFCMIPHEEDV